MIADIKTYNINGKEYQIEYTQQHKDGSLVVTFKPAPEEDDMDVLRA